MASPYPTLSNEELSERLRLVEDAVNSIHKALGNAAPRSMIDQLNLFNQNELNGLTTRDEELNALISTVITKLNVVIGRVNEIAKVVGKGPNIEAITV